MEEAILRQARDRAYSAPVPLQTPTYTPVPHSVLISNLIHKINQIDRFQIVGEDIYVDRSGEKMVGFVTVKNRHIENDPDYDFNMMLGYKNSYDKSMAVGLAIGLKVMICENGVVSGDMLSFRRKHTGTALQELNEKIDEGIILMEEKYPVILNDIEMLRDFQMTQKQKAELLGVMYFEENLVTPTQLSIVKREFNESAHFRGNTLWDLYNNVTESLKQSHPLNHIEDHIRLHNFMMSVVNTEGGYDEAGTTE